MRIQHPGMQNICNGCYGNHLRKDCENERVTWNDYVGIFKCQNPDIPESFYGTSSAHPSKNPSKNSCHRPTEKEFNIPTTQDELNEMMSNMRKSGFDKEAMMQIFKERKVKLNKALEEYEKKTESLQHIPTCH